MTAVTLDPVTTGRRPRPLGLVPDAPSRAPGPARQWRPLSIPEPEPRCRPARPTPAACGTRRSGASAAVRRRRVVLGTVAAGLLAALALPWSGAGGHSLATPGSALAGDPVTAHAAYVVQPGDTLWSIAVRLDPTGDPRPVVAQLAAEVGGDSVVPGERVVLP
ncbi:MAG: LysM domain-containing protein [Acidimicrobiales bacterium]